MSDQVARRGRSGDKLLMHARTLTEPRWTPLPHQIPPPGDWYGWLLLAGRGAGKSDACARYVHDHVMGPPCLPGPVPHWIGIIAPTLGDAATSCFSGPSGLSAHSPDAKMINSTGGTIVKWPNGSVAKLFGAHTPEDVERLRSGGNRCLAWLEEMAAWRYLDDTWAQMRFGLRSGRRPHWIASTTPKPRPLIKKLASDGFHNVVRTRASMYDNPHIQEELKRALEEGLITSLPTQGLRPLKVTQVKRQLVSMETFERILQVGAPSGTKNHQQFQDYYRFLLLTGAREKEALRVRWADIDFKNRQVTIGSDGLAKNHEYRVVDFDSALEELLRELAARRAPDSQWLFPSPQRGEKDIPAKTFRESLRLACDHAGVSRIGFHDARHHFVSKCVMAGIDFMTIAAWVGHKDGGVLIGKVYGHLASEHRKAMASKRYQPTNL